VQVLCAHREAFSSDDVEPLVPTLVPGVFANRFTSQSETVWTLYNANGRTVRGALLEVPHVERAKYEDAWNGSELVPALTGAVAVLSLELGPQEIGCIVQTRP